MIIAKLCCWAACRIHNTYVCLYSVLLARGCKGGSLGQESTGVCAIIYLYIHTPYIQYKYVQRMM